MTDQTILEEDVHRSIGRTRSTTSSEGVRWYGRSIMRGWWAWELIAATVSILAMAGLLAVLLYVDRHKQRVWNVGGTQLTVNTIIAAIGTIMRSSLLLVVAGALNQSAWNWFVCKRKDKEFEGQPLKDFEIFSEAAANSWNSMKLLWRTKGL